MLVVHLEVAHPVFDRTQPCLTSVKLVGLAGPLGRLAAVEFSRPNYPSSLVHMLKDMVQVGLHQFARVPISA